MPHSVLDDQALVAQEILESCEHLRGRSLDLFDDHEALSEVKGGHDMSRAT